MDSGGTTLATYLYDDLARRAQVQYNGTTGAKMLYSWSAEDDLLTLQSDFASTTNDVSFTNTFSPAHQWATTTISNAAFRFNPMGTGTNTFVSDVVNKYATLNGAGLAYDARANFRGTSAAPVFAYDAENHLVSSTTSGTAYTFDGMGRRTSRTSSSVTTNFLHDGDSEIAEYDVSGNLIRRFVPGPTLSDYIAMVTVAGTKTFFHADKMGSVVAMSDMSGGLTEGPYLYDPYGVCYSGGTSNCSGGVPFRYTGQRLDPENNCLYFRARNYCPGFGRFNQTDAIGYKDDLNMYTYVLNDPTNKTDPSGNDVFYITYAANAGFVLGPEGSSGQALDIDKLMNGELHIVKFYTIGLAGGIGEGEGAFGGAGAGAGWFSGSLDDFHGWFINAAGAGKPLGVGVTVEFGNPPNHLGDLSKLNVSITTGPGVASLTASGTYTFFDEDEVNLDLSPFLKAIERAQKALEGIVSITGRLGSDKLRKTEEGLRRAKEAIKKYERDHPKSK